jgi:transcription-repair coupling factor (superfamily II helicase)
MSRKEIGVLQTPLYEMAEIEAMKKALSAKKNVGITGCVDSQKVHMIYGLDDAYKQKIIVTFSEKRAKEIYEDLKLYESNRVTFPARDLIFFQADIHSNMQTIERMKAYKKILRGEDCCIITTFDSLLSPQMPRYAWEKNTITFSLHEKVEEETLAKLFLAIGYERVPKVEMPGQFSIHGGIIDIFDLTEENPFRIELWGEDIESIRSFDVASQRSIENKNSFLILPACEVVLSETRMENGLHRMQLDANRCIDRFKKDGKREEAKRMQQMMEEWSEQVHALHVIANPESLIKYFYEITETFLDLFDTEETLLVLDEPNRILEHMHAVTLEFQESMFQRLQKGYILPKQTEVIEPYESILWKAEKFPLLTLSTLEAKDSLLKNDIHFSINAKSIPSYSNQFETLVKDLLRYKEQKFRVILFSASSTRAKRLAKDLMEAGLNAFYSDDQNHELLPGEVMTYHGTILRGFSYPLLKFVVMAETDIFGEKKKTKRSHKTYNGKKILDFAELNVGDFVVHENHGLGIYQGIEKVRMDKITKDYIKIQYKDGGNLYILATELSVLQKYASGDAKKPKLNKLGSKEWKKTKDRVRSEVSIVAQDLVALYAKRQAKKGYQYGEDTIWQKEFEELFPYEETSDQLLAIEAVKRDMQSNRIMDRLVCGDVGYGKTEIAIRAAFKAVQENKQVAFLVPTTILAQQHYNTLIQRLKDFPIRVELLSRFRTKAEIKDTLNRLRKGMVDIVVGTHRLFSADVAYKNLGLLVVDEEQRFGVKHKEIIKQMKEDVDVITLTATPIPRTLHMSLIGIRDMSVLEEPPEDRLPIQTYVMEYNEEMVREAIVREISRGGQVFYVYNRVNTIADITAVIAKTVPEARVAYAHGQMSERELEKIMYEFINNEIDVLVSTTIIETGLDISNANTMIIHDSDSLGLSQLYQLRGRVGRSNRNAYAFLLYKRNKILKEVAEKRLTAIREFTELGSGFKIAMRDLEIRGAGNLLGQKQHGHMEAIGYDLYCRMLNQEVQKLKGLETIEKTSTVIDIEVDAFISDSYIVNEVQKLDIYKRIAAIENEAECNEMKEELLDRFGDIPKSVSNLLRIAMLRVVGESLFIKEIQGKKNRIKVTIDRQANLNPEKIPLLLKAYGGKLKFNGTAIPYFSLPYESLQNSEKEGAMILETTEKLLQDLEMLHF